MTGLLAAYREEETPLYPTVFVFARVQDIASLSPGTRHVRIGGGALGAIKAETVLKDCAPLAESGWAVYIGKPEAAGQIEYGVFRSLAHSYATSAEEAMLKDLNEVPIVSLRNRGPLVVELRNTQNQVFTAALTTETATDSQFDAHVRMLAAGVSADVDEAVKAAFEAYATRFLASTFQRCHGCLCAVLKHGADDAAPVDFAKSVWLAQPLAWASSLQEARQGASAETLAVLQSVESLIVGMINSDGVVVFGSGGVVLGYRAFMSPNEEERKAQSDEGGGRRRTHALMCKRLGNSLRVAFFRSQDGKTLCERTEG